MASASTPSALPLSRFPLLTTPSFDEAAALYGRLATPVRLSKGRASAPFEWRSNSLAIGPVTLSAHAYGGGFVAQSLAPSEVYVLTIPIGPSGGKGSSSKTDTEIVTGTSGFLTSPGQVSMVSLHDGYRGLHLSVDKKAMESAVATLTGMAPREGIMFEHSFSVDSPFASPFMRLLSFVLEEADREDAGLPLSRSGERLGEALLFRFLAAQPHNQSALFASTPKRAEPVYVRRAAEYLEAHLARPITLAELTKVVGVSGRSLQAGFQAHRGCSPLTFLRQRRLERAHALLSQDRSITVTQVAHLCGFEHRGRFAEQYRARFGQRPTQTRARR